MSTSSATALPEERAASDPETWIREAATPQIKKIVNNAVLIRNVIVVKIVLLGRAAAGGALRKRSFGHRIENFD